MSLGLKDYKPVYKRRPLMNLKDLLYEIKYACQRFWRGYDDTYLFDFDCKLNELIPEIIRWLRFHRHGSPILNIGSIETCHNEWNTILDEILFHFKEANNNTSEKNDCSLADDHDAWAAREIEIDAYREQHLHTAYEMIAKYIGWFWD